MTDVNPPQFGERNHHPDLALEKGVKFHADLVADKETYIVGRNNNLI